MPNASDRADALPAPNSALARRRLAAQLTRWRVESGAKLKDVAQGAGCSAALISRMENEVVPVQDTKLDRLFGYYGVNEAGQASWRRVWEQSVHGGDPWKAYASDLSAQHLRTYALVDGASEISVFTPGHIPALLQTSRNTRALAEGVAEFYDRLPHQQSDPGFADRLVALTEQRQQALARPEPPILRMYLLEAMPGEPVIGSDPTLIAEQLTGLIDAAQRPNITIQLLPREEMVVAVTHGPVKESLTDFAVVAFENPADRPGCYSEEAMSHNLTLDFVARFDDDPAGVLQRQEQFGVIGARAMSPEESLRQLAAARDRLPAPLVFAPRRVPAAAKRGSGPAAAPRRAPRRT